jgi:hypothetical protein
METRDFHLPSTVDRDFSDKMTNKLEIATPKNSTTRVTDGSSPKIIHDLFAVTGGCRQLKTVIAGSNKNQVQRLWK